tara:strand:+ start:340 stop:597 length:258 start_codon:yes stop_codon:yes gene_type:complete
MEFTKEEEKIIKTSMEFSYNKFWNTIELAAESKDKNEVDVAIGLILEGVSYMKQAGMSENELQDHIKAHYNSFNVDENGNIIEDE